MVPYGHQPYHFLKEEIVLLLSWMVRLLGCVLVINELGIATETRNVW